MLASIRKPYLNVDARSAPLGRHGSRNLDLNDSQASWTNIRHLTNEECDQIDMQARIILSRCADRVKEMETLEKRKSNTAFLNCLIFSCRPGRIFFYLFCMCHNNTFAKRFCAIFHRPPRMITFIVAKSPLDWWAPYRSHGAHSAESQPIDTLHSYAAASGHIHGTI